MKKNLAFLIILCLFIGVFISVVSARCIYADDTSSAKSETANNLQTQSKTVMKSAGMDIHIPDGSKHNSAEAYIIIPYAKKHYHPIKIHLDKEKKNVTSGFSRDIIMVEHEGFNFKIRNSIFNEKINMFTADAKITGHFIPGYIYAQYIIFNEKGIQKIEELEHRGHWNFAGFNFSPQALKWKDGLIEVKGLLQMKTFTADVTMDIGRKGISNLILNEKAFCKINNYAVTIDKITMKNNRFYVSGFSDRNTPKNPVHFNDIPVGANGQIDVKLPSPPKPEKPHELSNYKPSSGYTFQDMGNLMAGLAGLPGELLVKVANSTMTMRVTSVQNNGGQDYYSGYITLPDPLDRANITDAAKTGSASANLSGAGVHWQKDKVTVPIIHCGLTLQDDVKFKMEKIAFGDDTRTAGCLESPILGIFKILEIAPNAATIFTDGVWTNYSVQPLKLFAILKANLDCISPLFSTVNEEITFTVQQRQNDIGFYYNGECSVMKLGTQNAWLNTFLAMDCQITFDFRSTGYVFFYLGTGKECSITIIPETLVMKNPEIKFLRFPNFYTQFWIGAEFVNPETEKIFKVVGSFYLDVNGMGSVSGMGKVDTGAKLELDLFGGKVGEVSFDFDGNKKIFTCEGDISINGHNLFNNEFQMYLKKSAEYFILGDAYITISYWTYHIHKPHWRKEHKDIGIKYHIKRNGHFGMSFGKYNFHGHHGGGNPSYDGPFTTDGISYNGHMELVADSDIQLNGNTDDIKSSSGNDSVDTTLSINGTMDDTGNADSGTITTTSMSLTLKPTIPQSANPVEIDLNLTPTYNKDLQSNTWQTPAQNLPITFTYTDSNGNQQTFNQSCNFRIYLDQASMHIDLDLPPSYGGTYSQSFDLGGK